MGVLNLNGFNQTVASLNSTSGTNTGVGNNTITSSTAATFTVNGGGSYGDGTPANSGIISGAISLVKSGSGTLTLGDANTYTGTTTISGGTLILNRTGGTTIPTTSAVTVSGGTLRISTNQTLASLTVTSGTVQVDAGDTLTIAGNVSIPIGANLILNGVLTSTGTRTLNIASGATVTIGNSNGLAITTGSFSGGKTFTAGANYIVSVATITPLGTSVSANNFTVTAASTINSALTVTGTLDAQSGATLTTGSNITLSSNGRVDDLTDNSGGTINGIVTVEYAIPGGRRAFRLLSHPFANAIKLNSLIDDINITGATGADAGFDATASNNPSAFSFSESTFNGTNNSGWNAFTNASLGGNDIIANRPIRILYRGPRSQSNLLDGTNPIPNAATIDWANTSGNINQGTVNVAMGFTAGPNGGFNLLPNPYPSNYDLGNTVSGDRNDIGSFIVWVPTNATKGAYVSQSFGSTYIIPSGSAFFVRTGSAANFVFRESQKTITSASVALLKSDLFKENALQIDVISDSIYWDKLEIRNRDFGTVNRDQQDGPKMQNPDVNFFALTPDNEKLAIDNRNIQNGNVIPLGFEVSSDYNFTFKVSNFDLSQYDVQLVDKYLSTTTPLTLNADYKFTTNADAASKGNNRFELVFNKTTGIQEQIVNHFNLYPNPATESINLSLLNNQSGNYQFEMYNQVGAKVKSGSLDFSNNRNQSIGVEEYSNGVYIIKIYNATATQTIKFIK